MRKLLIVIMAISIMTLILGNFSLGDNNRTQILPRHLLQLAEKNGYTQIEDFYDKWDTIDPCFVYGYRHKPTDSWEDKFNSAVFWCKKINGSDDEYCLLFAAAKTDDSNEFEIQEILEWQNHIGGLALVKDTSLALSNFYYIDSIGMEGPKGVRLEHYIIRSYYGGIQEDFYKYDGKWLVRQLD